MQGQTHLDTSLQAWFVHACAMLPDFLQAALIREEQLLLAHPESYKPDDQFFKTARIASKQNTPLCSTNGDGVFTIGYSLAPHYDAVLVAQLSQPAPEASLYRILDWSVSWLSLLRREQDAFVESWTEASSEIQLERLASRFQLDQLMLVKWESQQAKMLASFPTTTNAQQRQLEQEATLCKEQIEPRIALIDLKESGTSLFIPGVEVPSETREAIKRYVKMLDLYLTWSDWQNLSAFDQFKKAAMGKMRYLLSNRAIPLAALTLIVLALVFLETDRHIKVTATIEAKQKQVIAAPFNGYIASSNVRPGDEVTADEVLASLEGRELRLERDAIRAQRSEKEQTYRSALAERDLPRAQMMRAQLEQVSARELLLDQQISGLELVSPLTGVVLSGDLSQAVGSPVSQGDVLFEVAPLGDFQLVLRVPEYRIREIQVGQIGEVSLNAFPLSEMAFHVDRIEHFYIQEPNQGAQFRVRATLDDTDTQLLSGMSGIARIHTGRQSFGRFLFGDIADWLWIQRRRILPW